MKWSLGQLYKYDGKPFTFATEYDFRNRIEDIDDILDIGITKIEGVGVNLYDDRYSFKIHIESMLVLEDAVTLEPIEFPINLDVNEIFDTVDDGEVNVIPKNTIDLEDVVWENVYLERPMRITKSSYESNKEGENLNGNCTSKKDR